jgi:hypothetical protein
LAVRRAVQLLAADSWRGMVQAQQFDGSADDNAEHGFWYRVSSAVLVGAGWTSAFVACCVAAPLSVAFGPADERRTHVSDDL